MRRPRSPRAPLPGLGVPALTRRGCAPRRAEGCVEVEHRGPDRSRRPRATCSRSAPSRCPRAPLRRGAAAPPFVARRVTTRSTSRGRHARVPRECGLRRRAERFASAPTGVQHRVVRGGRSSSTCVDAFPARCEPRCMSSTSLGCAARAVAVLVAVALASSPQRASACTCERGVTDAEREASRSSTGARCTTALVGTKRRARSISRRSRSSARVPSARPKLGPAPRPERPGARTARPQLRPVMIPRGSSRSCSAVFC